jgi:hypothetical protein
LKVKIGFALNAVDRVLFSPAIRFATSSVVLTTAAKT